MPPENDPKYTSVKGLNLDHKLEKNKKMNKSCSHKQTNKQNHHFPPLQQKSDSHISLRKKSHSGAVRTASVAQNKAVLPKTVLKLSDFC